MDLNWIDINNQKPERDEWVLARNGKHSWLTEYKIRNGYKQPSFESFYCNCCSLTHRFPPTHWTRGDAEMKKNKG